MSVKFVECDGEKVISELVTQFEEVLGETLQPSDERRIFLNQLAQVIVGIKASINDTGNQVLLRTARGEALDAIGEMLGVKRLPASPAKCTLRFTLSSAQDLATTIPFNTRATPNGEIYFATTKTLIIPAGSLTGEVEAEAMQTGESCNGFVAGQIKYIVDNVNFLKSVENTNETSGGADEEKDDSFRERIRLVPESFSTAGCAEGYIYWAKSASVDVGNVTVTSPSAGEVNVYILKADGALPDDTLLDIVGSVVSAKDKRPLTDKVTVLAPATVDYTINLKYYVSSEDEKELTSIQQRVDEAVEAYVKWQGAKIGRDINPDKLRKLLLNAGASRVDMTTPIYANLDDAQVALLSGEIAVDFEGFSE